MKRAIVVGVCAAATSIACKGSDAPTGYRTITGGDPGKGKVAIEACHCGACHDIPGVTAAHGRIGPRLGGIATRSFIAGVVPNTPSNMMSWLQDPIAVQPSTAMPKLGLDANQSRDVVAYLYTLR
jgi:cytochrome c